MVSHLEPELPPIAMTAYDSEQLNRLASAAARNHPQTTEFLAREIARADIVPDIGERPGLVVMGSQVLFRDDNSDATRWVTLVYPQDADVSEGKISVLSPIGAALIGLSVSQSIAFETPAGARRSLTVLAVRNPG
ncbi:MAG: nucleoside diphosphate kinase regulator [Pseudorhodoplanes sp.]|nr:Regulator of nucleoside diphosphate kinase [Pseudorhodoplanes sp.]MBW7950481.1 nucleoside diphosphate kinase regulator [Pseudorhodoplanes sp.]MCL4711981.1 nucleoside diphosphate kinase regulator [Pseudorhodoplanes sp.]